MITITSGAVTTSVTLLYLGLQVVEHPGVDPADHPGRQPGDHGGRRPDRQHLHGETGLSTVLVFGQVPPVDHPAEQPEAGR